MRTLAGTYEPGQGPEPDALEFSPEIVRPYPKAGPRKMTQRRGRRRQVELV